MTDASRISRRKLDHLELAAADGAEGPNGAGWDDVHLVHDCLPEMAPEDLNLGIDLLGRRLDAPLWITGMTGGHPRAAEINARLARAAQQYGIAMGVGSQRAGLAVPELMSTYRAAREAAPRAVLIANVGAPQLVTQGDSAPLSLGEIESLVSAIEAQALAIHLNFLQEAVQPEGDRNARGVLQAIERVIRALPVPVMVKETGAGISRERAEALRDVGVTAIDVAGAGGTSMVRIERARARLVDDPRAQLATAFETWGIPTAAAVLECAGIGIPVIATGGVRSGLDAARAVALGASAVGMGRPLLLAAIEGDHAVADAVGRVIEELRLAFYLTGSRTVQDLQRRGAVLTGTVYAWQQQRLFRA